MGREWSSLLAAAAVVSGALPFAACGGDEDPPSVDESRACLEDAGFSVTTLGEPGDEASEPVAYEHDITLESDSSASMTSFDTEEAAAESESELADLADEQQQNLEDLPPGLSEDLGVAEEIEEFEPDEVERQGAVVLEISPEATDEEAQSIRDCAGS